ncbi:hypothetical protein WMY93_009852 [Mugilogobius chulae]|uniref:SAP domain-containing protein n=1 Tax=Mugilogobius chulae TaxID=88201 RepID=A0AAW0PC03_9GOBI
MEASQLGAEGDCGMSNLLVPSPQSEAMTHEMEELSLQPSQTLPPLNERKNVLQLRLQQRRTREQLVDQGIMPPLKSPAAFHGQIRSLERARTENFLKHKIRSRPERAELVRMHILQETGAEPSLQATQMKLKRARLADNLNEKIAQRPGPMELVEKNILPVDSTLKQAIIVGQVNYPKVLDEDSSDALSPEQPASQESQTSAPSPGDSRGPETPSVVPVTPQLPTTILQAVSVTAPATTDFIKVLSTNEQASPAVPLSQPTTTITSPPTKPGPTLIKQSQQKSGSDKSREAGEHRGPHGLILRTPAPTTATVPPTADPQPAAATALQLPDHPARAAQARGRGQGGASIMVSLPSAPPPPPLPPTRPVNTLSNRRPGVLPANLEEMKVAELKMELKLRGLPVSGTKTDLIERLKPFQDSPPAPASTIAPLTAVPMEVTAAPTPPQPSSSPPNKPRRTRTPPTPPLPCPLHRPPPEKDRRLHEKERQIEELMRKLEQEQKLVEELKMQLEVEKKAGIDSDVKQETSYVFPNCTTVPILSSSPNSPSRCRSEPDAARDADADPDHAEESEGPDQAANGAGAAAVLHQSRSRNVSGPGTAADAPHGYRTARRTDPSASVSAKNTIQLPSTTVGLQNLQPVQLQAAVSNPGPALVQTSVPQLQSNKMEPASTPLLQVQSSSPGQFILQPASLLPQPPKSREPPRYEDAVKQSRNMLPNHNHNHNHSSQVSTATSQQMDDLFDILIESGEIAPFPQQEAPVSVNKALPVTAHISTLPVNTVLSRPPPQVQLAPPPGPGLGALVDGLSLPALSSLSSDNQLEALLESTLADSSPADARTQGLMEELQAQLMEHQPYSPMDTSELSFSSSPPSSLHMGLSDPVLDNMEWLDLTMPPGPGPLTPLSIPSDFLDSPDLQLHWD